MKIGKLRHITDVGGLCFTAPTLRPSEQDEILRSLRFLRMTGGEGFRGQGDELNNQVGSYLLYSFPYVKIRATVEGRLQWQS